METFRSMHLASASVRQGEPRWGTTPVESVDTNQHSTVHAHCLVAAFDEDKLVKTVPHSNVFRSLACSVDTIWVARRENPEEHPSHRQLLT
jgi:hypothetical protein